MDKKTKIFFVSFFALVAIVVTVTFCKYFILKDYYIEAEADCDPESEACFIWNCDPMSTVEGEKCTGDPETDIWYYKKIKKKAFEIPLCDPNDENCEALICHPNEECTETLCNADNVGEDQECNDPVKYLEENPPEEEDVEESESECDPDDDECEATGESEAEEIEEGTEGDVIEVEKKESEDGEADKSAITILNFTV